MMLWYKAWRESRVRFLAGAALIGFLCWQFLADGWRHVMVRQSVTYLDASEAIPYSKLVWHGIWSGRSAMFVMCTLLLGLGGVQRERGTGTAPFTFALPVTRRQLTIARAAVGALQVIALAAIPTILIPLLSPIYAEQAYPLSQALQFGLLYAGGGLVCYAVAFACSTAMQNEHTVVATCVVTPFVYTVLVDQFWRLASAATATPLPSAIRQFRWVNLFDVMVANDMPYRDPDTFLLTTLPWLPLAVLSCVSLVLFADAIRRVNAADF